MIETFRGVISDIGNTISDIVNEFKEDPERLQNVGIALGIAIAALLAPFLVSGAIVALAAIAAVGIGVGAGILAIGAALIALKAITSEGGAEGIIDVLDGVGAFIRALSEGVGEGDWSGVLPALREIWVGLAEIGRAISVATLDALAGVLEFLLDLAGIDGEAAVEPIRNLVEWLREFDIDGGLQSGLDGFATALEGLAILADVAGAKIKLSWNNLQLDFLTAVRDFISGVNLGLGELDSAVGGALSSLGIAAPSVGEVDTSALDTAISGQSADVAQSERELAGILNPTEGVQIDPQQVVIPVDVELEPTEDSQQLIDEMVGRIGELDTDLPVSTAFQGQVAEAFRLDPGAITAALEEKGIDPGSFIQQGMREILERELAGLDVGDEAVAGEVTGIVARALADGLSPDRVIAAMEEELTFRGGEVEGNVLLNKIIEATGLTGITAESAPEEITAAFQALGESMTTGVRDGMVSEASLASLDDASSQIAERAEETLRSELQSQSPSQVAVRIGQDYILGFIQGIRSMFDQYSLLADQIKQKLLDIDREARVMGQTLQVEMRIAGAAVSANTILINNSLFTMESQLDRTTAAVNRLLTGLGVLSDLGIIAPDILGFGGGRAGGGPAVPGQFYGFNETGRGGEVFINRAGEQFFIPAEPGTILPTGSFNQGGGVQIVNNVSLTFNGPQDAGVVQSEVASGISQGNFSQRARVRGKI